MTAIAAVVENEPHAIAASTFTPVSLDPPFAVLLSGSSAWLDWSIDREILAGDHDIVLLRVHELDADAEVSPLVLHASRFCRLQP